MFDGHGVLHLDGDHLDLSYGSPHLWPEMTPRGAIRSFVFDIGDPIAGPSIQLGLVSKVDGEDLDWASVDPVHHHGSDQFRILSAGEWTLAGRPMRAGGFAFQEAGWVYQERPGEGHAAWMSLVMGDRRGGAVTFRPASDRELEGASSAGAYPHPAGPAGIAAIATSAGPCERGYRLGRVDDLDLGEALTGVLGDAIAGPVVHIVKAGGREVVMGPLSIATELILLVVAGSCEVGGKIYRGGDVRIQAAGAGLGPLVSGMDGVDIVLVVADRRARAIFADGGAAPSWMSTSDRVLADLRPRPGGSRGARQAATYQGPDDEI